MRTIRGWGLMCAVCVCTSAQASETRCHIHLGVVPLMEALSTLSAQCGIQYSALPDQLPAITVGPLDTDMKPVRALRHLLKRSSLEVFVTPLGVLTVRPDRRPPQATRSAGMPEVLVQGSRILNADVERSGDELRPYVIFDRAKIAGSADRTVGELLRTELGGIARPRPNPRGSVVDYFPQSALHGLGQEQTLVLVNGRTAAGPTLGTPPLQPDVGAIPLAAVERVEILPASDSAVYGARAAAGVVNVVLRGGDDNVLEVSAERGGARGGVAGSSVASLAWGDHFNENRTHVLLVLSDMREEALPMHGRDGLMRGRDWLYANAPDYWRLRGGPPAGLQTNIASLSGQSLTPTLGARATMREDASGVFRNGYSLESPADAQPGGSNSLLQESLSSSALLTALTHQLNSGADLYFEFLATRSQSEDVASGAGFLGLDGLSFPVGSPNPFDVPIMVSVPAPALDGPLQLWRTNYEGTLGLRWTGGDRWHGSVEYSFSRAAVRWRQPAARSAAGDALSGTLNVFQDATLLQPQLAQYAYTLETSALPSQVGAFALRGAGTLFEAAAGPAVLTGVLEHRERQYGGGFLLQRAPDGTPTLPDALFAREYDHTESLYAALEVPLGLFTPFMAARVDRVRLRVTPPVGDRRTDLPPSQPVSFSSVDPSLGVTLRPISSLLLRCSFATGYIPPTAAQLAPRQAGVLPQGSASDSRRGDEPIGEVPIRTAGNPALGPERTRSVTIGAILTPPALPPMRLSIDRTQIRNAHVIAGLFPLAVRDPAALERFGSERVTRAIADPNDAYGVGPITGLDATDDGSGHSDMIAWHASLSYETAVYEWGGMAWELRADRHSRLAIQPAPDLPLTNMARTVNAPPRQSIRSVLRYDRGRVGLSWTFSRFSAYDVPAIGLTPSAGDAPSVPAQAYHDLQVSWRIGATARWPFDTQLHFNVQNVLGQRPPFDPQVGEIAGFYSPYGDPRLRRYNLGVVLTLR